MRHKHSILLDECLQLLLHEKCRIEQSFVIKIRKCCSNTNHELSLFFSGVLLNTVS